MGEHSRAVRQVAGPLSVLLDSSLGVAVSLASRAGDWGLLLSRMGEGTEERVSREKARSVVGVAA